VVDAAADFATRVRGGDPRLRIALALDVPDASAAKRLVDRVGEDLRVVKVGLELFTREGPALVEALHARDLEIFLDLKLHDIPNTMAGALRSMSELGVALTTVHALAGREGIARTREARDEIDGPLLLAVTVLTSHGDAGCTELFGRSAPSSAEVLRLGGLAIAAGAQGLVASPREAAALRTEVGTEPLLVIPGIRPLGSDADDQQRIATPAEAIAAGADLLVVGRPLRNAANPREAFARILDEIQTPR